MQGIDVSENNGFIDWEMAASSGVEFAIIRLGWGKRHLDRRFYENINGAINAGLKVGVYYYSYAVTQEESEDEADFVIETLDDCGLTPDKLEMGVWIDEEDADKWRSRHGLDVYSDRQLVTNMAIATVNKFWGAGFMPAGVYMNCDWKENVIDMDQTGGAGLWLAQPDVGGPAYDCNMWQYTFNLDIGDKTFDGDIFYNAD